MSEIMDIKDELLAYTDKHKGTYISDLTFRAAVIIDILRKDKKKYKDRVTELEQEKENMTDDGR